MVCPPKQGPLAESSGWNKLVKDIKERFDLDDIRALKLAEIAFYKKGEMPSSEEAISILSNKGKDYTKTSLKEKMRDFATGLKTGMDKGFLAGQMRQGRSMAEDIRGLEQQVASGEITQKDLEARVKELKYEVGFKEAEARLAGEIAGKRTGRKEGVDKQRAFQKEFAARVKDYLKTNEKFKGKINEKQMDAIVNKAAKIGTSERAYAKFTDYVDKVIEKENYAEDLSEGTSLRSKIKRSFADSDDFVKRMKKLDIEKLSPDELIEFNKLSKDYISSTKPITAEGYTPFEREQSILKLQVLEKAVSDKIIKDTEDAYGVLGLTREEADLMNEFMTAEDQDLFAANLSEAKQKQLRYNLERVSDYALLGLRESLATNKEAMTQSFGKTTVDQLEDISKANVSTITDKKDLAEITRTINNHIINGTNSNVGKAHTIVKAYEYVPKLRQITNKVVIPILGFARKAYEDTPIIFKALFGDKKITSAVRYYTGYDGVVSASSKAETDTIAKNKLWNTYKKENNIGNSAQEDVTIGIYSRLSDVEKGNENEGFLNEKAQLEETINRLEKSENPDDVALSEYLKSIYEQTVKDVDTHQQFVDNFKKEYPKAVDASEWISNNLWKEKKAEFKNHAESNLNQTFDADLRNSYHPKSYYNVGSKVEAMEPGEDAFNSSTGKPKETGRSLSRTLKDKLPDEKVVDYRFEYNTFKNYQDELFEINSFHDAMLFSKMTKIAGYDDIFGGKKNADFFKKTYNIQYDLLRNGKKNSDALSKSNIMIIARSLKNIGTAQALGRLSQVLSQSTPAMNTIIQAGKYFKDVMLLKGANRVELLNLRQIGARGAELGSAGKSEGVESLAYDKVKTGLKSVLTNFQKTTGKLRELTLKPLSSADVNIAKKTFLSFYLKYMNEAGVNVTAKDLATEHLRIDDLRNEALSYAQQATDEMQGVSNRAMLSELKRNDGGSGVAEIALGTAMPFNNFASNTKARMLEDVNKLWTGNKQQKIEASQDLAGSLVESAAFSAVNAYIVTGLLRYGIRQVIAPIFGLKNEDDVYEYMSKKFQVFYTGFARENLLSGFGGEVEAGGIELLNMMAYNMQKLSGNESGKNYYEWLKEEPLFKSSYKVPQGDALARAFNNMGSYGIALRNIKDTYESVSGGITGVGKDIYGFEKETEKPGKKVLGQFTIKEDVPLTEEQKNFYLFTGLMQGMSLIGLGEQDILRAAQSIKNDITKAPKTATLKTLGGLKKLPRLK
jgi:hypothetical protein